MNRFGYRGLKRPALTTALLLAWVFMGQPAEGQIKCFPSCSSTDGKFLVIASGTDLVTLSEERLEVQFAVPAGATSFTLGIFDGDSGEDDGAGRLFWDLGDSIPYSYTLYADPSANGSGMEIVEISPGVPVTSSSTMPSNAWIDYPISTTPEAQAPSGNYFYRLEIELLDNSAPSFNAFKLRTNGVVSIRLADQPFSYIGSLGNLEEAQIIYPLFPLIVPTTYDGTFRFFFDLPEPRTDLSVWDGDFDHGDFTGLLARDTDDPDTPNDSLPPWATVDAVLEGAATGLLLSSGNPPDDADPTAALFLRPPSIFEQLVFPDGQIFTNANPSGNQEWEQFRISTDPFDPSVMDASTSSVPAGPYELRIRGVDMSNLNAVRLPAEALCVSEDFVPCMPLRPFLVGDTVFRDFNADGIQFGDGETGIPGVEVELVGAFGFVITTTTTDADGHYEFPVEAGTYTVRIAAGNSDPGGPLEGAIATTPPQATETVVDDNVLTYDFGYRGTGSLGDRVWLDLDGDGVQDPVETGINGVTVELLDGAGNIVASTTTSGDGNYLFDFLFPGSYSVRVVASSLHAGLAPTYDLDGIATPGIAAVTLGANQDRTDIDFGYRGTASIGDRLWNDTDGDGVQDGGEPGLNGVTVELLDGSGNVVASTTTAGNGNYSFNNLPAGTYTVRVVSGTLPAGFVPTYDLDGTGTPHTAALALTAGQSRTDVDFGYRTPPACMPGTFKDTFTAASFSNNEGSLSWAGAWVESDVAGTGVGSGNVTVGTPVSGYMILRDDPDTGTQPSVARQANLASFAAATLTVDFHIRGVEPDDAAVIEVSNNGGASYTVLETLTGYTGTYISSRTFDITAYKAANTRIRFRISSNYGGDDDFFKIDQVRIDAACTPQTGSIGDRLWYDTDGDGVQDSGEPGLAGTTVELLNSGGTVIATKVSDSNGVYTFTNLAAGTYTVRVVTSTFPVGGLAPTYDRDGTGTPHTATVNLASGQTRTDVDFGYRGTRSLGDRVWKDLDGDGTQDSGEPGINGVTVRIFLGSTEVASTVTAGDGNYSFTNLPETTFTVKIDTVTLPSGMTQTYDLDGLATPHQATVNLTASRTDVDFGYRPTATCTAGSFKDNFDSASFSNNNGTLSWSGAWIESDSAGAGVSSGNVTVGSPYAGYLFLRDSPDTGTQPSAARQANLSGFSSATLSFSFHARTGVDPDDAVVVEISKNGGSTYTVLETLSGFTGTYTGSRSYNISSYIASNTRIRFRVSANYGAGDELFKLDWVKIDAGCTPPPPSCTAGYVKDHFDTASFSNNDGTLSWAGAWVEYDTAGTGVSSGNVTVGSPYSGYLFLRDAPDTGTQPSAARQVNLSSFSSATLSFSFHARTAVDPDDAVVVEISKNGGSTYTVLETLSGFTGTYTGSRSYNISSSIASNTRIRFRVSANYGASDELFKLDWVKIDASCP